jgi:hypothetical protein
MEHVDRPPLPLRIRRTGGAASAARETLGLAGVIAQPGGRTLRAARAPGTAVARAWTWDAADRWSRLWWPQGVALGEHGGVPVALVSWFAQERRGIRRGARLSVVDLGDERRPRYRHVLLVTIGADGALETVPIHAGGIAWLPGADGGRLYAAATFGGIREFRLADLARARGPFRHRLVLPQSAELAADGARHERLRYSFVSAVEGAAGTPAELVAGEYRADDRGRIARLRVSETHAEVVEVFVPGIVGMQGVALRNGTWSVSASRGDRVPGDLWRGPREALVRHAGALPPGPEDLASDARGRLWGTSEFPRRRWLYELERVE